MAKDEFRDRFYLAFGLIGLIIAIAYFMVLDIPFSLSNLQDVSILSIYTMAWTYFIISVWSLIFGFILEKTSGIPREKIWRWPFNVFLPEMTVSLLASVVALFLLESLSLAFLVFLIVFEIILWFKGRKRIQENT